MNSRKLEIHEAEQGPALFAQTTSKIEPNPLGHKTSKETTLDPTDPIDPTALKQSEKPPLTKESSRYFRSVMQRTADTVTIKKNPDGSSAALLNGTFQSVSAAKRLPDGTLVTRCFESFDALEKFLDSGSTESR